MQVLTYGVAEMTIKKTNLERLKKKSSKVFKKISKNEQPNRFDIGAKAKSKPMTYIMDSEVLAFLDELAYKLKRRNIRVSVSKIVRVSVAEFSKLSEEEQIERLMD